MKNQKNLATLLSDITFNELKEYEEYYKDELGGKVSLSSKMLDLIEALSEAGEREKKFRMSVQFMSEAFFGKLSDWNEEEINHFLLGTDFDKFDFDKFEPWKQFRKDWKGKMLDKDLEDNFMGFVQIVIKGQLKDWKVKVNQSIEQAKFEEEQKAAYEKRMKAIEELNKEKENTEKEEKNDK